MTDIDLSPKAILTNIKTKNLINTSLLVEVLIFSTLNFTHSTTIKLRKCAPFDSNGVPNLNQNVQPGARGVIVTARKGSDNRLILTKWIGMWNVVCIRC